MILRIPGKIIRWFSALIGAPRLRRELASTIFDDDALKEAVRFYVPPRCTKSDPAHDSEPFAAATAESGCIFQVVNRLLAEGHTRHILVLADSGMGKTSFLLNFFFRNYSRVFRRPRNLLLVSLARPGAEEIIKSLDVKRQAGTILLLDALDEDVDARGRVTDRLGSLLLKASTYRGVIITCRSQFFRSDADIPSQTGVARIGAVRATTSKEYQLERLYLAPFDDRLVRRYLWSRFPIWNFRARKRAWLVVRRVPSLSVRPMLLSCIAELIDGELHAKLPIDIYESMVDAWAVRERGWVSKQILLRFSALLAVELYTRRAELGGELASADELERLAESWGMSVHPENLTTRSLLNRAGDGKYKFAHRSLLEYFVAKHVESAPLGLNLTLTDQIAEFVFQRLTGEEAQSLSPVGRRVHAETVTAEIIQGYATNLSLYVEAATSFYEESLFEAGVVDDPEGVSLGAWLAELIARAKGGGSPLRFVWLTCDGIGRGDEVCRLHISAWAAGGVALGYVHVPTRFVLSAFSTAEQLDEPFLLIGEISAGRNKTRFIWTVRYRRVRCQRAFPGGGRILGSTATFCEDHESKTLVIRILERGGALQGSLARYGLIGIERAGPPEGKFLVLPVRRGP